MPSKYVVVQFIPDPAADERINIGVLTYDAHRVECRFLKRWGRVRMFAGKDAVNYLKDFASAVCDGSSPQESMTEIPGVWRATPNGIEQMVREWDHTIQFTEPRGSLKDPGALVETISRDFLTGYLPLERDSRPRQTAARIASTAIRNEVAVRFGKENVDQYFIRHGAMSGKIESHNFDFTLRNGSPRVAGYALSFEGIENNDRHTQVTEAYFQFKDTQDKHPDVEMFLYMLPPTRGDSKEFKRTLDLMKTISANCVIDREIEDAARVVVAKLPQHDDAQSAIG